MSRRLRLNEWWGVESLEDGYIYPDTLRRSRSLATQWYDGARFYGAFRRDRRRGEVRCRRVMLVPSEEGK